MTLTRSLSPLLFGCCASMLMSPAMAQRECQAIADIETLNEGTLERTAHIEGEDAILFIALDPVFSAPEFDYGDNYRDEYFIDAVRNGRESLYGAGIDEIVVWRLPFSPSGGLGVAIPFKEGCAVSGYGEPDFHEKLMLMDRAYREISRRGLDASSVRNRIERLIKGSRYSDMYTDEMVDIVIDNLRPLIGGASSSDQTDTE